MREQKRLQTLKQNERVAAPDTEASSPSVCGSRVSKSTPWSSLRTISGPWHVAGPSWDLPKAIAT
eukprot:11696971-Prorocentrum_lima.AAC.1